MIDYAWLVPILPLLGSLGAALSARKARQNAHIPVIIGTAGAFIFSLFLLFNVGQGTGRTIVYPWIEVAGLSVPVELRVDGLTTMMLSMVTFVSTLVAVYAAGYMHGDPGYPRFFACIGLFVFSMSGLVLSSNFLLTYVFWEGVGTCSFLLVGFWYAKPAAAAAAKKAFMVNRVGDFGFAIAMFWMWSVFGHTLSYDDILNPTALTSVPESTKLGIALLLFWAATAKSAQLPLYVWLPDAMEGPTPVSALIHAATMVTAGVYLIARTSLLIQDAPMAQLVIASIGCVTALLAALIAVTHNDLKRVMAYSTISQLGYMFMALGAGIGSATQLALVAAMFHLFTHAFFKALLFLASGSVMHAMGGVIDMRRFRGLRHRMPITCWTFAAGGLALAGFPLTAGFFSKDEILAALRSATHAAHEIGQPSWAAIYWVIFSLAVFTAFLTAFYTGRAFFMTFFGPEKLPSPDDPEAEPEEAAALAHASDPHTPGHDHGGHDDHHLGHESPRIMLIPMIVLAVCALVAGLIFGPTHWFEHHLARTPGFSSLGHPEHGHGVDLTSMALGTVAALLGIGLSWRLYAAPSSAPSRLARTLQPLYRLSMAKFFVDEIYNVLVITPIRMFAKFCSLFDIYFVDGFLVRGTAWIPRIVGREVLAPFQNGLIQFYAAVTALGVAALLLVLLLT
ncbi:MAG: NADH-quinone oxidoreductase subunit L [Isosphaeraceae bacterium]